MNKQGVGGGGGGGGCSGGGLVVFVVKLFRHVLRVEIDRGVVGVVVVFLVGGQSDLGIRVLHAPQKHVRRGFLHGRGFLGP